MKETARKFLDKSAQSIAAAEHLLRDGYAEFAASRAYYAMFYAAEALLSDKGGASENTAGSIPRSGSSSLRSG